MQSKLYLFYCFCLRLTIKGSLLKLIQETHKKLTTEIHEIDTEKLQPNPLCSSFILADVYNLLGDFRRRKSRIPYIE